MTEQRFPSSDEVLSKFVKFPSISVYGKSPNVFFHIDEVSRVCRFDGQMVQRTNVERVEDLRQFWFALCHSGDRFVQYYLSSKEEDLGYISRYFPKMFDSPTLPIPLWLGTFSVDDILEIFRHKFGSNHDEQTLKLYAERIRKITGGVPRFMDAPVEKATFLVTLTDEYIRRHCADMSTKYSDAWDKMEQYVMMMTMLSEWKIPVYPYMKVQEVVRAMAHITHDGWIEPQYAAVHEEEFVSLVRALNCYVDPVRANVSSDDSSPIQVNVPEIMLAKHPQMDNIREQPSWQIWNDYRAQLTDDAFEILCGRAFQVRSSLVRQQKRWDYILPCLQDSELGNSVAKVNDMKYIPSVSNDKDNQQTNVEQLGSIMRQSIKGIPKYTPAGSFKLSRKDWNLVWGFMEPDVIYVRYGKSAGEDLLMKTSNFIHVPSTIPNKTDPDKLRHLVAYQPKNWADDNEFGNANVKSEGNKTVDEFSKWGDVFCSLVVVTTGPVAIEVNKNTLSRFFKHGDCYILHSGATLTNGYTVPERAEIILLGREATGTLLGGVKSKRKDYTSLH